MPRRRPAARTSALAALAFLVMGACAPGDASAPDPAALSTGTGSQLGTDPSLLPEITTTTSPGGEPVIGESVTPAAPTAGRSGIKPANPRSATVGTPRPPSGQAAASSTTTAARTTTAKAVLDGDDVTPPPGDPRGSGSVTLTMDPASGQLCFELTVRGLVGDAESAHVHRGPKGAAGEVVASLPVPPSDGTARGCIRPAAAVVAEMDRDPAGFYVDVHTRTNPAGAVRGQLARA